MKRIILLLCLLILANSALACSKIYITITADDNLELFFNGQSLGSREYWLEAKTFEAKPKIGVNVIAVKAINSTGSKGILVDAIYCGNKVYSDDTWKATSSSVVNWWAATSYNDSSWGYATDFGAYGVKPWEMLVIGFPEETEAHWIWASSGEVAYFRKTFTLIDEECDEEWSCTEWTECINETQNRECTDSNKCGEISSRPSQEQICLEAIEIDSFGCEISSSQVIMNTCSREELQYQYGSAASVRNIVKNLIPDIRYDITIENITKKTTSTVSMRSNSSGILEFSPGL
ncbi:MAG: hypothetical protein ABID38_06765 [Candidatus Diapherotrites archaeon]